MLPELKLGSFKIRRTSLLNFVKENEGKDMTDLNNIKELKVGESNEKNKKKQTIWTYRKSNSKNNCMGNVSIFSISSKLVYIR